MTGTRNYQGLNITLIQTLRQKIEALRESEEKFETIFESIPDGILLADVNTMKFSIGNKAMLHMLGYTLDELKKLGVADIHPKKDLPYVIRQFEKQARREIGIAPGLPVKRKDGSVFYADINSFPLMLNGKKYLAGVFRDVTELKKAEEKIVLFKYAIECSSDAIGMSTPEGRHYYQNKAFDDLFGDIGNNPPEKVYVDKKVGHEIFNNIMSGKAWSGEVDMYGKHKQILHILAHANTVKDDKGKIMGLIGTHVDVTERKKAEEALRESEAKYKTLLENLPQKIFFKDRNSVYISCNKNYARDLKIKPEQIVGKTDLAFYPKKLARKYQADDRRIMKTKKIEDIEEEYVQNGKKVFVRTIKTPVKDENGEVRGILGTFWEIVPHKGAGKTKR